MGDFAGGLRRPSAQPRSKASDLTHSSLHSIRASNSSSELAPVNLSNTAARSSCAAANRAGTTQRPKALGFGRDEGEKLGVVHRAPPSRRQSSQ